MTFLVKHGESDYRIHLQDGTEPLSSGWSERPTANQIADQCAADAPGNSLLGQTDLRTVFVDITTNGLRYRDLTNPNETVPLQ
jgi:hypothetical protein